MSLPKSLGAETVRCVLKSGESFLGDLHEERADGFVLNAGERRFFVPHSEIATVEREVSGPQIEASITLTDGSLVRGALAREDRASLVIASGEGFIVVPRRRIRRIETRPVDAGAPPDRFRISAPGWNEPVGPAIGLRAFGGSHSGALSGTTTVSGGGGIYFESAAQWLGFMHPGLELSYASGRASVQTALGRRESGIFRQAAFVAYSHYHYSIGETFQLYGRIGGGVSSSIITSASASARSTPAVFHVALGWRIAILANADLRIGLRSEVFFPSDGAWARSGLEVSFQYAW